MSRITQALDANRTYVDIVSSRPQMPDVQRSEQLSEGHWLPECEMSANSSRAIRQCLGIAINAVVGVCKQIHRCQKL